MNAAYTKGQVNDFFAKYTSIEWICVKWSFLPIFVYIGGNVIFKIQGLPLVHHNLCSYIDCSSISIAPLKYIFLVLFVALSLMYLFEFKMILSTIGLFILNLLIFSYYESVGEEGEWGLISLIFLLQSIAYIRHYFNTSSNLYNERMQFPLQLYAAAYILAAIAKLRTSGIHWFTDEAVNSALAVFRYHISRYASTGDVDYYLKGNTIATLVLNNLWAMKLLLALAVLLEIFAFVLMLGKKYAFFYGILLVLFHIGVFIIFAHVAILSFFIPILCFTINPLYGIICVVKKLLNI